MTVSVPQVMCVCVCGCTIMCITTYGIKTKTNTKTNTQVCILILDRIRLRTRCKPIAKPKQCLGLVMILVLFFGFGFDLIGNYVHDDMCVFAKYDVTSLHMFAPTLLELQSAILTTKLRLWMWRQYPMSRQARYAAPCT